MPPPNQIPPAQTQTQTQTIPTTQNRKTHISFLEYLCLYIPGPLRPALPRDLRPFSYRARHEDDEEEEEEEEGERAGRGEVESSVQVTPPNSPSGSGLRFTSTSASVRSRFEDGVMSTMVNEKPTDNEKKKDKKGKRMGNGLLLSKEGYQIALVLNNSGSTARDHLASERTFLAYVRTSLALSSTGVALVQLLAISDFSPSSSSSSSSKSSLKNKYATSLGSTLILLGILVLLQGCFRYFAIQIALTRGVFPATRIGVLGIVGGVCVIGGVVFGILISEKVRGVI